MKRLLPVLVLLAACRDAGGTLTARWIVAQDTTSFRAPITASWCLSSGRLDLLAVRGDSGIGFALYPADSAHLAVAYTVMEPGGPIQLRPGAGIAVRWFGKTAVQGYWGRQGTVKVARSRRGRLGFTVDAMLVSTVLDAPTLALTGTADGISIRADSACANAVAAPPANPAVPGPAVPDSAPREID